MTSQCNQSYLWHHFSLHTQWGQLRRNFLLTMNANPWCIPMLYSLNAERQASNQHVPFIKTLVWLVRGSNRRPPRLGADVPTESGKTFMEHCLPASFAVHVKAHCCLSGVFVLHDIHKPTPPWASAENKYITRQKLPSRKEMATISVHTNIGYYQDTHVRTNWANVSRYMFYISRDLSAKFQNFVSLFIVL